MLQDVSLEIIQKCLNNCIHCSSNSNCFSKAILDLPLIKDVIDDIVLMGAKRLCLSGGEPFLHPELLSIVQYAASKGLTVDIYSSGICGEVGDEHSLSNDILRECKSVGLNRIMFNLQSTQSKVYDSIMQTQNNFEKVLESIKRTQQCGIETEIHFVPMKQNYKEIGSILRLAKQLDVCQVSFLKLVPHGRASAYENDIMLSQEQLKQVQEELYSIKQRGEKVRIGLPLSYPENDSGCHAVKEKLYIKFDGSVFGCEAFKYVRFYDENRQEIIPDNIKEKKVDEICTSSKYLNRSKALIQQYACMNSGCENCPIQKYLKEKKSNV